MGAIPSMLISDRMLSRQIDWLAKRFSLMSLDEIGSRLESGRPFEKPAAAITFDDGYSDVYHHAYPLLKRKGVPAAFFVVTGLVDTGRPQVFDRLYLLIRLLHRNGMPPALALAAPQRGSAAEVVNSGQLASRYPCGPPLSIVRQTWFRPAYWKPRNAPNV